MIYAAIDPGSVSAAIAIFDDATALFVDDIRTTNGMVDSVALAKALKDMLVRRVVIENVHSMPRQGVSSTFKFGMGTGIIHGVAGALRLPVTLVAPTINSSASGRICFERVVAGELSADAAEIEAGWRRKPTPPSRNS